MKIFIIATALLVLAGPGYAADRAPTPAQLKDMDALYKVFGQCGGTDADDDAEPQIKRACALSRKLQERLMAQGFCFYKRIEVGRPNKAGTDCEPLPGGVPR